MQDQQGFELLATCTGKCRSIAAFWDYQERINSKASLRTRPGVSDAPWLSALRLSAVIRRPCVAGCETAFD